MAIDGYSIAIVIPAFQAELCIASVLNKVPSFVDWIIIVDDNSKDNTKLIVKKYSDQRIILLNHEKNLGVGGAMVTGFRKALDLKADLISKIDADGQMDPYYLDRFARVCILYNCDYVKANRFGHISALPAMPKIRLAGNLLLTFLTKFVSGYWNIFDPQNGYFMITRKMLKRLNLARIDESYFFENSMLINLNILKAKIGEIYLPANYGNEVSSMKLRKIFFSFPQKLMSGYCYRVFQKYIFRSLSPYALLLFFGIASTVWGIIWGGITWYKSFETDIPAATGSIILALLPLILGWTSLLQALVIDMQDAGSSLLFDYDDETLKSISVEYPSPIINHQKKQ
ncbi:MAG: glycosyltransferase family 2 protein [Syntrophaceae bacterium]|nr:glycosyltransferase family 2 protein [Syntrophaceae bacterium]